MSKFCALFGVLALLAGLGDARAWEPSRPIQIVVGYSAGGGTDVIARALATASQGIVPVPVVVVNRPGAAGAIAAEMVATAKPDGYTLMVAGGSESTAVPNFRKVNYSLRESFRPIIHLIRLRMVIVVRADSPIKSYEDYVTYARKNPGKLNFGTAGPGGLAHAVMLLMNKAAGIETQAVAYKGDSELILALLAGDVDATQVSPDQAMPHVQGGRIRVLAVGSRDRFPGLPQVPTLGELGYDVTIENMKGIVGPAGMPDEIYEYLHGRFRDAMQTESFRSAAARGNFEVNYMDGPRFGKAMLQMSDAIREAAPK